MSCRGIRGAITVPENTPRAILDATRELLCQIIDANGVSADEVASAIFTVTPDLNAAFPAQAARELGWTDVALISATEIPVPGALARCIRVLVHWNTPRRQDKIRHIYLQEARRLRPDLTSQ